MDPLLQPLLDRLGPTPEVLAAARELLDRWAEPHRRYHDRRHLAEVLGALSLLCGGGAAPTTTVLAAYWHDAVYAGRPDDEERSAQLAAAALPRLGVQPAVVADVARLVRLTATHRPDADDADGALLCDADLAVLASGAQRYAAYATAVREEYAHLDDAAFHAGRRAVLEALLDQPHIYRTDEGRRRWEAAARHNVQAELSAHG